MANLIVGGILFVAFSLAIYYIVSSKRKGVKCIGCPHGGGQQKKDCVCDIEVL